jgi:alpha-glucosidase
VSGVPSLNPVFFKYPTDPNTFGIELQFFFGHSILVSPVTEENATDVTIYLPNDIFYDWYTYKKIQGRGSTVHLTNIDLTTIPLHIKSGSVLPLRAESAMTTKDLRTKPFNILIAPDATGKASGTLYIDDGISIEQSRGTTNVNFVYGGDKLSVTGEFNYEAERNTVSTITVLGVSKKPSAAAVVKRSGTGKGSSKCGIKYDKEANVLTLETRVVLDGSFNIEWK